MKVTWHKLSEQEPKSKSHIWVYYAGVSIGPVRLYEKHGDYYQPEVTYWAYAEMPEPPEEEKHYCRSVDEHGVMWTCKDFGTPGLFHLSKKKNGLVELEVTFCPFCGDEARYTEDQVPYDKEQEQDDE